MTTAIEQEHWEHKAWLLGAERGALVQHDAILTTEQARLVFAHGPDLDLSALVRRPDLSGEYVDEPTPDSLTRLVTGMDQAPDVVDALSDSYEHGVTATYTDAIQAAATRILGHIDRALELEEYIETTIGRGLDAQRAAFAMVALLPSLRVAVQRGATYLDDYFREHPELLRGADTWRDLINVDRLDMSSFTECVLGQVWMAISDGTQDYRHAADALYLVNVQAAEALGFWAPLDPSGLRPDVMAETLADLWREYLAND